MRVGFVSYINTYPLTAGFLTHQFSHTHEVIYAPPAVLNKMLDEKKLDIALTSSVSYLYHREKYNFSSEFGIVAHKKVLSVNFYTKLPLKLLDYARIGITSESATSVALLKILAKEVWNVTLKFETLEFAEENYDGFLLIGDKALARQKIKGFTTIDLAQEWNNWAKLPFVFALFIYQKEISQDSIENFISTLRKNYEWGQKNPQLVLDLAEKQSQLSRNILKEYFNHLDYTLSEDALKGLEKFYVYTAKS